MKLFTVIFCLLALMSGCQPVTGLNDQPLHSPFFDLDKFVHEMATDTALVMVKKFVEINGQMEERSIDAYPYYKDIQNFEHYDINRPALFDKYHVDTIDAADGKVVINHGATDEKLKVRHLSIRYTASGEVDSIGIHSHANSFLEEMHLYLHWLPAVGYEIVRKRSMWLKNDSTIQKITVQKVEP